MTSEQKSASSRANGAKSRGPKTAETREKSSRNSLQHGFASRKTMLLGCENPDEFQELLDAYHATYHPVGPIEQDLVNEMASSRWRSERLSMIATSLLDMEREAQPVQTGPSADPARPLALGFKSLVDGSRAIPLAMRYEFRLRRVHEPPDHAALRGRYAPQRCDQRQGHLVLAQVESRRLPRHRFGLRVVEQVVRDLERHAEQHPEPRERLAIRRGRRQGAHFAGPRQE